LFLSQGLARVYKGFEHAVRTGLLDECLVAQTVSSADSPQNVYAMQTQQILCRGGVAWGHRYLCCSVDCVPAAAHAHAGDQSGGD
jgi:hypothetical protein